MATVPKYVGKPIGLRDLTWFPLVSDVVGEDPVYGTPIKLARAITAVLAPVTRTGELESDDGIEDDVVQTSGWTLTIDANQINQAVRSAVFGHEADEAGGVTYNESDVAGWGALAWKSKLSTNDGTLKYAYHVLYRGRFQDFTENFETARRGSMTYQTHTGIQGNFYPLESTGDSRYFVRQDAETVDPTMIAAWFTKPQFAPGVAQG